MGWSPLIQTRFLVSRPTLDPARRLGISDTRLSLSPAGLPSPFSYLTSATTQSEPRDARITVWALSISLAATLEIDKFSFSSSGYLDVSVPRVPHVQLCIHCTLTEVSSAGFPHSDISGSQDMCSSPKLFAAYHVFHRLLVPRHPPYALSSITNLLRPRVWTPLHISSVICVGNSLLFLFVFSNQFSFLLLQASIITSDVLIFFLSFHFCMRFSRYILTVLSVIRNLNLFHSNL